MRRILLWMTVTTALLVSKSSAAADSYVAEPFEWKKETKLGRLNDGDKSGQLRGSSTSSVAEAKTNAPYGNTPLVAPSPVDDGTFGGEHKTVTAVILPWEAVGSPHDSSAKASSPTPKDQEVGASLKDGEVPKAVGTTNELQPYESVPPEVKNNDMSAVVQKPIDEGIGLPAHTQQPTDPYTPGTNALHESEASVQQPIFPYSSGSPSVSNDGKAPAGGDESASPYNVESSISTTKSKTSVVYGVKHADGVAESEKEEVESYHDSSRHKSDESSEYNSNGRQHDAPGNPSEDKWAVWGAFRKKGPLKESVSVSSYNEKDVIGTRDDRVKTFSNDEKQGNDSYSGTSESVTHGLRHEHGVGSWEYESSKSPGAPEDFVTSFTYGETTSRPSTQPKSSYDDESPGAKINSIDSEKTYNPRHPDEKSTSNNRDMLQGGAENGYLNAGSKNELHQRYSVGTGAGNDGNWVEWQKATDNKSGRQRREPEAPSEVDKRADESTESAKVSHKEQVSTTYNEDGASQESPRQEQTASPYDDQSVIRSESSGKPLRSTSDGIHNVDFTWANRDSEAPNHSTIAEPKLTHKSDGVGGKLDEDIAKGYKNTVKGGAPEASDSELIGNKKPLKEQHSADKIEQSIQNSNPPYSPEVSSSKDENVRTRSTEVAFKEKAESYDNLAPPSNYDNRDRVFEPPGYDSTKTSEGDRHYKAEDKESTPNSVLGSVVPWSSGGSELTNKYAKERTTPTPSRIEPGVYSEVVDRTDTATTKAPGYILGNTARWNEHHALFLRDLQSEDRAADEQPTEQPSMQSAEKPIEQPIEQPNEQSGEKPSEPRSGQSSEEKTSGQSSEQSSERPKEQSGEKASEQPTVRESKQPSENPTEQSREQSTEQSSGQPSEQESKQPSEQPTEHSSEQSSNQSSEQPSEQSSEQAGEDTEQSGEQSAEQSSSEESSNENEELMKTTSVEDTSVRWDQDDCHPCDVPTVPPTLSPLYPHNNDDYESHLPNVTEDSKPWEEVKENGSKPPTKKKPRKPHRAEIVHCMKVIGEYGQYYECDNNSTETTATVPTETPSPYEERTPEPTPTPTEPDKPTPGPSEPTPVPTDPYNEPTTAPPAPTKTTGPTPAPTKPSDEPTPTPTKTSEPTPAPTKPNDEPTPAPTKNNDEPTPSPTKPSEPTPAPTKSFNEPTPTPAASTTDGDALATFTTDKKASTSVTTTPSTTNGATTSTTGATTGTAETYTDSTTTGTTAGADKTEVSSVSTGSGASGSKSLGGGAIAGIVIACVVFVVVVVAAVLFRQRSIARQREENLFADLSATGGRALETDYAAM